MSNVHRNPGRKIPGYQTVNQYAQTLDPDRRALLQTRRLGRALASWCKRLRPNGDPHPTWVTHSTTREHAYPTEAWDSVLATEADVNAYFRTARVAGVDVASLEARIAKLEEITTAQNAAMAAWHASQQTIMGILAGKVTP